jgi:hypothetical protein
MHSMTELLLRTCFDSCRSLQLRDTADIKHSTAYMHTRRDVSTPQCCSRQASMVLWPLTAVACTCSNIEDGFRARCREASEW